MNKENCALKLVDEIILYYDARSKIHQNTNLLLLLAVIMSDCSKNHTKTRYIFPGQVTNLYTSKVGSTKCKIATMLELITIFKVIYL